ncbi:PREDICTED: uncharacterized protein LOC106817076 [Priapulus caudatus]|uniref:Uncharacterized protein LOC106817076 n=1 Tax=Priapulus caudatus TaxID=37621 RepID=A0ABM1EYD8_PRICU|nr:PREDICTED: uncharacterized protein LOC106817076 [Priapulus caudatus]
MRVIAADGFIAMTTEQTAALGVVDIEDDEEPLPDAVVLFWRPLVRALHSHGLVPLTALSLLEALREEEHVAPSRRATILKWVARILEDSSCRVLPSSRRRVNLFARRTKAADWRPVLRLLLQLPCRLTAAMLKRHHRRRGERRRKRKNGETRTLEKNQRIGNLGNEEAGVDLEQSVNDNVEVKETIGNCFREEAFWDEAQMNDIKKHLNIY